MIKKAAQGVLLFFGLVLIVNKCFAIELLNKEKALKKMFPDEKNIVTEVRALTDDEIARIKERLGGKLVHFQKGSKLKKSKAAAEVEKGTIEYTFYFVEKDGIREKVAVIEEQPGKWGTVKFIIALNAKTAKVENLAVMAYKEKRGRPIARRNFLKQFIGKGSDDKIKVRKDIRAISGATISSDSTCFAVKKVIVLYEEVFLAKETKEEKEEGEKKKEVEVEKE